jgi:hypothetical protein
MGARGERVGALTSRAGRFEWRIDETVATAASPTAMPTTSTVRRNGSCFSLVRFNQTAAKVPAAIATLYNRGPGHRQS